MNVRTTEAGWIAIRSAVSGWSIENPRDYPWRGEVPQWRALVTEILLQRTRAESVEKIYHAFFERFPTASALGESSEDEVQEEIYSLGLAWRAKYLRALGVALAEEEVSDTPEALLKLPGVGPYVSAAYLALHRDRAAAFVDANVVRLLGRFWGFECDGETRRKRWLLDLVATLFDHGRSPREFGYALLDFTREVCGVAPRCEECPAQADCAFANRHALQNPSDLS